MRSVLEDPDDWTPLKSATVALNEMFNSLKDSGFEEHQALRLISLMMTNFFYDTDEQD